MSVHLSDLAHDEFKRIPKGQRSRVVSKALESRSLDATTQVDGLSGHELADMVVELRSMLEERSMQAVKLAREVSSLEKQKLFMPVKSGFEPKVREAAKAEVAARLKKMGEDE